MKFQKVESKLAWFNEVSAGIGLVAGYLCYTLFWLLSPQTKIEVVAVCHFVACLRRAGVYLGSYVVLLSVQPRYKPRMLTLEAAKLYVAHVLKIGG